MESLQRTPDQAGEMKMSNEKRTDRPATVVDLSPRFPVAIVGYSYRMPGGNLLRRRLLAPVERARNRPGAGGRPLRERRAADQRFLRREPSRQRLRRADSRRRRVAVRPLPLRGVPERNAAVGAPGEDAVDVRLGGAGARRLGSAVPAQQPDRRFRWSPDSGGGKLAGRCTGPTSTRLQAQAWPCWPTGFPIISTSLDRPMAYCTACSAGISALHSAVNSAAVRRL